ncbi:MAG: Crp/Fnr family transcriptional regulator [Pseudomonadota bacterium]
MKFDDAGFGNSNAQRCALSLRAARAGFVSSDTLDVIDAAMRSSKKARAGEEWMIGGQQARDLHVVVSGWATRVSTTRDGRRVITQFLLPGDVVGGEAFVLPGTLTALTDCEFATLTVEAQRQMRDETPEASAILDWSASTGRALMIDHIRSLSAFRAAQRVMHLLVTLWQRLRETSDNMGNGFMLPLTQSQISETCGMSLVHTNKSIAKMRADGLLTIDGHRVSFPDPAAALRYARWDDDVLTPFGEPKAA